MELRIILLTFTSEIKKMIMKITGYKTVSYSELQGALHKVYADYKQTKTEVELAMSINVKSLQTVRNAFQTNIQIVSDAVLTNVMTGLGFNGFVVWKDGERLYYIKSK